MTEYLVTLRVKADYDNGSAYRGTEDVVLVEAENRWVAIDLALRTREARLAWYVYRVENDS